MPSCFVVPSPLATTIILSHSQSLTALDSLYKQYREVFVLLYLAYFT